MGLFFHRKKKEAKDEKPSLDYAQLYKILSETRPKFSSDETIEAFVTQLDSLLVRIPDNGPIPEYDQPIAEALVHVSGMLGYNGDAFLDLLRLALPLPGERCDPSMASTLLLSLFNLYNQKCELVRQEESEKARLKKLMEKVKAGQMTQQELTVEVARFRKSQERTSELLDIVKKRIKMDENSLRMAYRDMKFAEDNPADEVDSLDDIIAKL